MGFNSGFKGLKEHQAETYSSHPHENKVTF